ncbi:hypothetical protein QVN42_18445, partial [Yersinia nurmii]
GQLTEKFLCLAYISEQGAQKVRIKIYKNFNALLAFIFLIKSHVPSVNYICLLCFICYLMVIPERELWTGYLG